jgi:hypothetical protein
MRRWMAAPLVFAAFAALFPNTPRALAQDGPVEETFLSADGVQLRGLFLKSEKTPASDPVVILLYPPGKDNNMDKGDWKGLAARLSKEGYNVFRFDWRGHGKSTDIKDTKKFWTNDFTAAWNHKYITGAPVGVVPKKIKNDIFFKDIKGPDPTKYTPVYMLDLAAARYHLDTKNDAGDVNTSSVYLIGAESAATIGIGWMTAEWNRPKVAPKPGELGIGVPRYEFIPQPLVGGIPAEAGEDISGAIWLSATRPPPSIKPQLVQDWVAKGATKLRENNPVLFLHGAKDPVGKAATDFFFNQVLVANPPKNSPLQKLEQAFVREVKDTKLVGVQLLGNNKDLGTEDTIMKFVEDIQKERAKIVRRNRTFDHPYFIDLSRFGMNP